MPARCIGLDHAEHRLFGSGQLLDRVRAPALAGFLGPGEHAVALLQRPALLALDDPHPRRRRCVVGLPGVGDRHRIALLDVDHAQHGDLGHPAHPVIGALAAVDQAFVGHVAEKLLEGDLLLPLEPEGAGDLALAGRAVGGANEFKDLLLAGQAMGFLALLHRRDMASTRPRRKATGGLRVAAGFICKSALSFYGNRILPSGKRTLADEILALRRPARRHCTHRSSRHGR